MSDISFSKLTWENLPARTTALSATNLNRIENGIADSVAEINSLDERVTALEQGGSSLPDADTTRY